MQNYKITPGSSAKHKRGTAYTDDINFLIQSFSEKNVNLIPTIPEKGVLTFN